MEEIKTYYKLSFTPKCKERIEELCRLINKEEWSGVLFTSHTGSFEGNNLEILCEDILLMDIGNAVHTEFEFNDPIVATYQLENDLLHCDANLCHSHVNMEVFFSGTDTNTLMKAGEKINHFVSLIVNNRGEMTAKITRKILYTPAYYMSFSNEKVDLANTDGNNAFVKVETFDLLIDNGKEYIPKDKFLLDRVSKIRKVKEEKSRIISARYPRHQDDIPAIPYGKANTKTYNKSYSNTSPLYYEYKEDYNGDDYEDYFYGEEDNRFYLHGLM